jgi:protein-disulfide isomerase
MQDIPQNPIEEIQDTTPPIVGAENTGEQKGDSKHLYTPVAILIGAAMISGTLLYAGVPAGVPANSLAGEIGAVVPSDQKNPAGPVVSDSDHIRGNPSAPITIVEFSDFQCPFCSRFHPTVQQALNEYGDQVRRVYKHFPLAQIHAEAIPAAEASECIAEQKGSEGFWAYGDQLFANQERLGVALYRELAEQQGANMTQFNTCIAQRKYQSKVEENYNEGLQLGITGTPGSFINGVPVRGALPYDQIKAIIENELAGT